ncbi:hypothetical protein GCM10022393_23360 [Aquimarina addita]|uniref:ApeA N-terminal domain-containing protein n=1 Tax=Aquimarina addita TaxID=870485 RepID=A0ABP6UJP3_9FLAO
MLNIHNLIESPNPTYLEVGKIAFLYCDLKNFPTDNCTFYIYRIDDPDKKIGNYKEIIIKGAIQQNSSSLDETITELRSIQPVAPKLSWFEEKEEEIRAAFDVEVDGIRIKSSDHIIIIKKGNITINLYWGDEYKESNKQKVRVYAEYLRNGSDVSYYSKFKFKLKRTSHALFYGQKLNKYKEVSEESRRSRKKVNEIIVAESDPIEIDYFLKYFCEVNILPELLNTDYEMQDRNFRADKEELKIFKRDHLKGGEEIISFLRSKELIPDLFYDNLVTKNEFKAYLKKMEEIRSAISDVKDIMKKRSLHGFALSRLQDFANLLIKNWEGSKYIHKFFKNEYEIAIRYIHRTKDKRKQLFENWLEIEMGMLPGSSIFNERRLEIQDQLNDFNALPHLLKDSSYGLYLNTRVHSFNEMIDNFDKFQKMFDTIEQSTINFLKEAAEKTNFTF